MARPCLHASDARLPPARSLWCPATLGLGRREACVKCNDLTVAEGLLEEMLSSDSSVEPDLITFSTIIKGYCYAGCSRMCASKSSDDHALVTKLACLFPCG